MKAFELILSIAQVMAAVAWPAVALTAGLVFKKELRALIGRIRKGAGLEFDTTPQATTSPVNPLPPTIVGTTATVLQIPRTPSIIAWEQTLREYPPLRQITDPGEREKALLLIAASVLLTQQFEQVENAIWASQLVLLNHLNAKPGGEALAVLRQYFYDPAAKAFPEWFANYPFQHYTEFLLRNLLLEPVGDSVRITQRGTEYLRWRIELHKPPKFHG